MITSPLIYERDFIDAQNCPNTILNDKQYLLNQYESYLKRACPGIHCHLNNVNISLKSLLKEAKIVKLTAMEYDTPNTVATIQLPDDKVLRGEFELKYDRESLSNYFNLPELFLEDKVITVEWEKWVEAATGKYHDLANMIHSLVSYKLADTFTKDAKVIYDDRSKAYIKGHKPLALIIPALTTLDEAWKFMHNVSNYNNGSYPYQSMIVHIRLVSSNHLIIEDGEAAFKIKLVRPLHRYRGNKGGK